jgi:hypothetical protein
MTTRRMVRQPMGNAMRRNRVATLLDHARLCERMAAMF